MQQPAVNRPSLRALIGAFAVLGLTGFGGWLAYFHDSFVEKRRWLTNEEYLEGAAIANIVPGASFLNFAIFASHRLGGWRLVPLAVLLILGPGAIVTAGLIIWYDTVAAHTLVVVDALRGLAAAAAGLVIVTPIRLLRAHSFGIGNLVIAAMTFLLLGIFRFPMLEVVLPMLVVAVWVNRPIAKEAM